MERKKNVLILGKLPPPYIGPAIATNILLKSKLKNTYTIQFHSTKLSDDFLEFTKFSLKKCFKLIRNYSVYLKRIIVFGPDLTLIPIGQTTISILRDSVYIVILKIFHKKYLLHLRGSNFKNWYNKKNSIIKTWVRFILLSSSGMIVLGAKLKYLFGDLLKDDKIFIVPNGGDFPQMSTTTKSNIPNKILYLGNLQPSKGIEDLIDALVILRSNRIDFECEIIGQWSNNETYINCMKKVIDFKLPVSFLGVKIGYEKSKYLLNADIFVFPPREPEGHPWVIVEALAAGLPIIATDQGAISESVKDGINGFIVEKNNPKQIAEKIITLLKKDELRIKMGIESFNLYKNKFTEKCMIDKLTSVINTVLKEK